MVGIRRGLIVMLVAILRLVTNCIMDNKIKATASARGFTLIECLVALFIIAVVLASASRAIALTTEDIKAGYLRQAAIWVAENQLNQYRIDRVYPELASTQNTVNMANVSLIAKVNVVATANPYFRRVEVGVATAQSPKHSLIKLISFSSQY